MAYQTGRNDYAAIRDEANDPYTLATPVSADELEEMLDCVPPIYVTGGFLVGECITGDERGAVYAHYAERDGQCYARYAVLGRDDTLIPLNLSLVERA